MRLHYEQRWGADREALRLDGGQNYIPQKKACQIGVKLAADRALYQTVNATDRRH